MKKYHLVLILLIGSICSVHAQNADQQVIASSGDATSNGDMQLSWTLGQVVGSSTSNNSIFLNEGFHQSEVLSIELGSTPEAQQITIYPNPTVDYVELQLSQKRGTGSYQLTSLKGDVLMEELDADFTKEHKINMMDFIDGIYLLTIKPDDQSVQQFKIIKN